MRLLRVCATNFLGYEELDLDLSGVNNLVVVGDNMAGKSTILDAVTWALFDSIHRPGVRPSSDKVIRDGADHASVRVTFDSNGDCIEVTREKARGKTGTLMLHVNGEQRTRHTSADTFTVIAKHVGLSLDGLLAGPWMAQKQSDSFMGKQPRDRKDLLIGLLELDVYERLYDAAKRSMQEFEASRVASVNRLAELQTTVVASADLPHRMADARAVLEGEKAEYERRLAEVAQLQTMVATSAADAERMGDLMSRIAHLHESKAAVSRSLEAARLAAVQYEKADPRPPDPADNVTDEDLAQAQQALQEARDARERYITADAAAVVAQSQRARAQTDAALIETVPCQHLPFVGDGMNTETQKSMGNAEIAEYCRSCRFLTDAVAARDSLPVLDQRVHDARDEAESLRVLADTVTERAGAVDALLTRRRTFETAAAAVTAWQAREDGRVAAHEAATARIRDLEERFETESVEYSRLQAEVEPLRTADDAHRLAKYRLEEAQASVASAKRRAEEAEAPLRELMLEEARRDAAVGAITKETEARDYAAGQAATYRILATAFHRDGIPTNIIEATIPVIEDAANEVLARLPGDLRLSLRTQREGQKGGMIDRLEVVVTTDGWERDYGMLSVGGRFRVDLALRLGLARVLTHRTGTKIETLWWDEPLADLDAESREAVVETLATVAEDFDLSVVVSHHPEFNDHFTSVLNVSMEDGVSRAELAA